MSLTVEIITPEKLALKQEADFIAAPAVDGEIGILPHHTPLLVRLGVGELRLKKGNNVQFLAIAGGFLQVEKGSHVSVFAETAEMAEDIDVERARLAAEAAKTKLVKARDLTLEELTQVEMSLSRAITRIKVGEVRRRRRPTAESFGH